MRLFSWLKNWTGLDHSKGARRTGSGRKPAKQFRPQLEALDERLLPSFTAGSGLPGNVWAVAVGNFNNDNNLDLASISIGDMGGSTLTVQLGNKAGIFYGGHNTDVGFNATALAVGNFNNDKNLDIIVVTNDGNVATVWLGNGDGTFSHGPAGSVAGGAGGHSPLTLQGDQTV